MRLSMAQGFALRARISYILVRLKLRGRFGLLPLVGPR